MEPDVQQLFADLDRQEAERRQALPEGERYGLLVKELEHHLRELAHELKGLGATFSTAGGHHELRARDISIYHHVDPARVRDFSIYNRIDEAPVWFNLVKDNQQLESHPLQVEDLTRAAIRARVLHALRKAWGL